MNRAERRWQNKSAQKPEAVRLMTDAQIKKLKYDAIDEAFKMLLSIPNIVLSDHFQFDKFMLDEFNRYSLSWTEGVQKGEVTLTELLTICRDEAGIELIETKRRKTL